MRKLIAAGFIAAALTLGWGGFTLSVQADKTTYWTGQRLADTMNRFEVACVQAYITDYWPAYNLQDARNKAHDNICHSVAFWEYIEREYPDVDTGH